MHKDENDFVLRIYRGFPNAQYWEEFKLKREKGLNIISALMLIQRNPMNIKGEKVTPVVWEQGCLEEVCGSCSMLVNGFPRQACSALIETIIKETGNSTISLAPFTKFPLVRDLIVNRDSMFENLKLVNAWIDTDETYQQSFGPLISQQKQEVMYSLSTCMTCGCCVEACPQINKRSSFIGPQIISQVRLFNDHPIGKLKKAKRLRVLMKKGGISECGNAQNCVKACPKNIPLTDSIAAIGRDATLQSMKDLFSLSDRDDS